ncbi:MAG: hypothetical protein WD077_10555 [Bacteroidia bacterium]
MKILLSVILFLVCCFPSFAQDDKVYQVFVGQDTVKYFVLHEGKMDKEYSLDKAMTGYILIPQYDQSTHFHTLKAAAFQISAKHHYNNSYYFSNELAFREILYAREMEIDPDENTVRSGFLCKVEGNVFKMSYFEW